jgi:hypothetical protein
VLFSFDKFLMVFCLFTCFLCSPYESEYLHHEQHCVQFVHAAEEYGAGLVGRGEGGMLPALLPQRAVLLRGHSV